MDYEFVVHSDIATVFSCNSLRNPAVGVYSFQLSIQGWFHETVGNVRPITRAAQAISSGKPPLHHASCLLPPALVSAGARLPRPPCVAPDRVARQVLRHVASARLCGTGNFLFACAVPRLGWLTLRQNPRRPCHPFSTLWGVYGCSRTRWSWLAVATDGWVCTRCRYSC